MELCNRLNTTTSTLSCHFFAESPCLIQKIHHLHVLLVKKDCLLHARDQKILGRWELFGVKQMTVIKQTRLSEVIKITRERSDGE